MQDIRSQLKKAIRDLYGLNFDPEITPSPDNIDTDYSTNAPLKLAKKLHKPPMEIARELFESGTWTSDATEGLPAEPIVFESDAWTGDAASVTWAGDGPEGGPPPAVLRGRGKKVRQDPPRITAAGPVQSMIISPPGFLNFTLDNGYLKDSINNLYNNFSQAITSNKFKGKTVICEFSDPNPFKVLHVGHLYTSIVGDAISRLYEFAGAHVIRANFGGDVGLHVAKTLYILQQKSPKDLTIEDIAKCYIEGTAAYDNDEHAKAEITKLNKEIYRINAEGLAHGRVTTLEGAPRPQSHEDGGGEVGRTRPEDDTLTELYWRGRELSYDYFRDFYATIGVKFDKYYPESTVATLGLKKVREQLKAGVYEMSDGAVIFDGDKYGLHTRVFINKEGIPTYETKDVGLIFAKWDDYHFDKSIVITGNEQKDYMAVVLKSIEQYAPELTERTVHLTHGLVKLPGGVKMSSRKGNFLKAVDVLDMVRGALAKEHNSTDEAISLAATKYAFLKYKMGGNIIFDPEESVKMTGNSGPYLLYSCVRAKKILQKNTVGNTRTGDAASATWAGDGPEGGPPPAVLRGRGKKVRQDPLRITTAGPVRRNAEQSAERNLTKKILEYKEILDESVTEMAPHKLANYLYDLAQTFSRFYEHCPVTGSDREAERTTLTKVYLTTMTHGLDLLGITIPEEM